MADTKISALTDGTTPVSTDEFAVARSGANVKLTWDQIQAAVTGAGISADPGNALTLGTDSKPLLTTVDQTEAEAGTATTGRGWTALRVRQAIAAWWQSASSSVGRSVVTAADAAAGRTAIGAQRDGYVGPVAVTGTPTAGQVPIASSGTAAAWGAVTAAPAGSDTQVQFNDNGALAGAAGLIWDKATRTYRVLDANGTAVAIGSASVQVPRGLWGPGASNDLYVRTSYTAFGVNAGANVLAVNGGLGVGFASGDPSSTSVDSAWRRIGAGIIGQYNGANAQEHQWYGTRTDASNYRRAALGMSTAGVGYLRPEGAGTGASGNVLHISGLPTSNPGPGILWNDAGTVKVGT